MVWGPYNSETEEFIAGVPLADFRKIWCSPEIRQVGNEIIIKSQFRFLGHTCMISCKICTRFLLPSVFVDP